MLAARCLWLEKRHYLPIEGIHYDVVSIEDSIGSWTLEWFGFKCLTDNYIDFRRNQRLAARCLWLEKRHYLPIEGIHYDVVSIEDSIGSWTLEWFGFKCLTDNYIDFDEAPAD